MSWVSRVLQSFVYTCLTEKTFQVHLNQAKQNCAQCREMLLQALTEQGLTAKTVVDGLNVWLPVGQDSKAAAYEFSRKGWLVRPSESFDIDQASQAVRVSVQNLEPQSAAQFAKDAAAIIKP